MSEKCFCHLNGFKVKDADARVQIQKLLERIKTLEELHGINNEEIPDSGEGEEEEQLRLFSVVSTDNTYASRFNFVEGMTWREWIDSSYNTDGFTVEGDTVKSGPYLLYNADGSTLTMSTDTILEGVEYKLTAPESESYTISYYTRKEYNDNGTINTTAPELIATQSYKEGETIAPRELPSEEGYTASEWT